MDGGVLNYHLGAAHGDSWNCTGDAFENPHVSASKGDSGSWWCAKPPVFGSQWTCSQGTVSHSRYLNNTIAVFKSKQGASCKLKHSGIKAVL